MSSQHTVKDRSDHVKARGHVRSGVGKEDTDTLPALRSHDLPEQLVGGQCLSVPVEGKQRWFGASCCALVQHKHIAERTWFRGFVFALFALFAPLLLGFSMLFGRS